MPDLAFVQNKNGNYRYTTTRGGELIIYKTKYNTYDWFSPDAGPEYAPPNPKLFADTPVGWLTVEEALTSVTDTLSELYNKTYTYSISKEDPDSD